MNPLRAVVAGLLFPGLVQLAVLVSGSPASAQPGSGPRTPGELSSSEPRSGVAGSVAEELRRQQELLERVERGEPNEETDLPDPPDREKLALGEFANPRVAPLAPTDRPLPVTIFDEEPVEIPAGRWGNASRLTLTRRVLDADRDGKPELLRYVLPGSHQMVRQEKDRNYDGIIDSWSDYESGSLVARVLDSNHDGNPDVWERYRSGRMTSREIDRDDDGVRDAFFRYEGSSLVEERHDANNDGSIDLHISYDKGKRVRAEEDRDHDGRMDIWRGYSVENNLEFVSRIERDKRGRGFADTFETFESRDGEAVLARREEDVNGDGEVDVVSVYENGKLIRREILAPDLVPL